MNNAPEYHLARVHADGTLGPPEIVPLATVIEEVSGNRREVLKAGLATSSILMSLGLTGCGNKNVFAHKDKPLSLAFSPDGSTLASAEDTDGGIIKLWNTKDGTLKQIIKSHAKAKALVFSLDGKVVIAQSNSNYNQPNKFLAWQLTENSATDLPIEGWKPEDCQLSPGGKQLGGAQGTTLKAWSLTEGGMTSNFLVNLDRSESEFVTAWFSTDERTLIATLKSGDVKAWRFPSGQLAFVFSQQTNTLVSYSEAGEGKQQAFSYKVGITTRQASPPQSAARKEANFPFPLGSVDCYNNELLSIYDGEMLQIYNLVKGTFVAKIDAAGGTISHALFHDEGRTVFFAHYDVRALRRELRAYHLADQAQQVIHAESEGGGLEKVGAFDHIFVSRDGQRIAVQHRERTVFCSLPDGKQLHQAHGPLTFSPDGQTYVTHAQKNSRTTLTVHHAADGKLIATMIDPAVTPPEPPSTSSGGSYNSGGGGRRCVCIPVRSDRGEKENIHQIDEELVLANLADLAVHRWNYRDEDPQVKHIGPMAQDFAKAFGVGDSDQHIYPVDAIGVALASIRALNRITKSQDMEIQELKRTIVELREMVGAPCTAS